MQHAESVTSDKVCVTHHPLDGNARELGSFATQSSTPLHGKANPRMSSSPPSPYREAEVMQGGWVSKIPLVTPTPPAPAPRNTARPCCHCVRTALVTPPGTLLPPPRAGLGTTVDAATLNRLPCHCAKLGREVGCWHNQRFHRWVAPQGTLLWAFSGPALQFMSAKCLFLKLLDHIYIYIYS